MRIRASGKEDQVPGGQRGVGEAEPHRWRLLVPADENVVVEDAVNSQKFCQHGRAIDGAVEEGELVILRNQIR
jgi:hypothetical protein